MGKERGAGLGRRIGEEAGGLGEKSGRNWVLDRCTGLRAFYLSAQFAFVYEAGLLSPRAAAAAIEVQGVFGKSDFFPRF